MKLLELYKGFSKWSWPTSWHLQFGRYCTISFPCKSLYLQITAKVSKIMKIVQCDLTFIYIELLEALNSFVEIRLVLEIRNVVSFIKHVFIKSGTAQKCVSMRKGFMVI